MHHLPSVSAFQTSELRDQSDSKENFAHVTQAQTGPWPTHVPSFQNVQALTTSIWMGIMQNCNTANQKNEHLNTSEPITSYMGSNISLWEHPFVFVSYIAIYIQQRKISVNSHSASLWLAPIPKQKNRKTDISEARFMLKCRLQCGAEHLVTSSAVILEVTVLLIPASCFPDGRIWGDWSHWG